VGCLGVLWGHRAAVTLRDPVVRNLERLKWYLWHGNVYKALQVVQSVEMDLDIAVATSGHGTARKLLKAVVVSGVPCCSPAGGGMTPRIKRSQNQPRCKEGWSMA
jgi:hypothetical protein